MGKRTTRFYTEMFFASVFAIVAASMWVEWTKGFVARNFANHPSALMAIAVVITLLSVLSFQMLFAEEKSE